MGEFGCGVGVGGFEWRALVSSARSYCRRHSQRVLEDLGHLLRHARQFRVFDGASFSGLRFKALLHLHFIDRIMVSGGPAEWVHWHLEAARTLAPDDPMLDSIERRVRNLWGRR